MRLYGDLGDEAARFRRMRGGRIDDPFRPRAPVNVIDLEQKLFLATDIYC